MVFWSPGSLYNDIAGFWYSESRHINVLQKTNIWISRDGVCNGGDRLCVSRGGARRDGEPRKVDRVDAQGGAQGQRAGLGVAWGGPRAGQGGEEGLHCGHHVPDARGYAWVGARVLRPGALPAPGHARRARHSDGAVLVPQVAQDRHHKGRDPAVQGPAHGVLEGAQLVVACPLRHFATGGRGRYVRVGEANGASALYGRRASGAHRNSQGAAEEDPVV